MPDTNQPTYEEDEITLKEVILKIQEFILEAWRHKWWIVAAGLGFAAVFLIRAMLEKPTYTATLTFMVNEDEGGSMGGIATILGQFGLGTGARAGRYNMDKIVALARSRKIVQGVLFDRVDIGGEEDYIANHIIKLYDYHENWKEDTLLQNFYFTRDSVDLFDRAERRALMAMHGQIVGNPEQKVEGFLSISYNDDTGILSMGAKSEVESLSIAIAEAGYRKLSKFYVDKTIEQQKLTVDNLQFKVDSIGAALTRTEQELAQFQDRSQGVMLRSDDLRRQRLSREVQMLTIMYGESIKNLETASFLLKNSTPVFQLVDRPMSPIQPLMASKLKAIVLGGFLGGFLSLVFIFIRKVFRDAMNE